MWRGGALILTDPWEALLIMRYRAISTSFLYFFYLSTKNYLNFISVFDSWLLDRDSFISLFFVFFLVFLSISTFARFDSWMREFYYLFLRCWWSLSLILSSLLSWISWITLALSLSTWFSFTFLSNFALIFFYKETT